MTLIYRAGRQWMKLRILFVFSFAWAFGMIWWGLRLLEAQGWPWLLLLVVLGLAMPLALTWFIRHFITRIWLTTELPLALRFQTGALIGGRMFEVLSTRVFSQWRSGEAFIFRPDGVGWFLRTPCWYLRVQGFATAFIVDAQGQILDKELFARWFKRQ